MDDLRLKENVGAAFALSALVLAGAILWALMQEEQAAPATTTQTGADAGTPWNAILANGGLPSQGSTYWGGSSPFIDVTVNSDAYSGVNGGYIPMFGFVGVATGDVLGG
jgi:hypothetical protein